MDRSIDLIVCELHTAWQVFVQSIVALLTSPLLPFHPKVFLFRLFLIVFCFLPCCFVLCPRPSLFCVMSFFAKHGQTEDEHHSCTAELVFGSTSPALPTPSRRPFFVFFVRCFFVAFCIRCSLHFFVLCFVFFALSLFSLCCVCVLSFFGEKPKQKGSPKPRLASQLKAIRFEK